MIPPIITIPATTIANPQSHLPAPIAQTSPHQVRTYSLTNRVPLNSPDLQVAPSPKFIAQSELPGSSTPPSPTTPPSPSIRDTGDGYPTRIPANYFGPALGIGNGSTSFGLVSRFPLGQKYSIRPSAVFGSNGTTLRIPVTYDFNIGDKEPFERNPLVTFNVGGGVQFASGGGNVGGDKFSLLGTIGVDVNLFEGVALVASYNTDFASNNGTLIGLGFEF